MCTVCPSLPVPRTLDTGLRVLICDARLLKVQTPHRVQPQPHTYPQVPQPTLLGAQVPQPTLLGARESDETTLPLLNRAIPWSFHLKAHSVHAPATSIRIVCENMMQRLSQASQLDKCKSMHVLIMWDRARE